MKNITGPGVLLEGTLEQLHDCSFLSPYPKASYHGKVSEKKTSIGYFFWGTPRGVPGSLCKLMSFGYCLLRNKYLMTCVLPLIIQRKETVWRFQVEAHVAYTCKQILGLCQKPNFGMMCPSKIFFGNVVQDVSGLLTLRKYFLVMCLHTMLT